MQPVDGAYRMTWEPPASWGTVTERIPCVYRGLAAEQLRFTNHPPVFRLCVRVHGVD